MRQVSRVEAENALGIPVTDCDIVNYDNIYDADAARWLIEHKVPVHRLEARKKNFIHKPLPWVKTLDEVKDGELYAASSVYLFCHSVVTPFDKEEYLLPVVSVRTNENFLVKIMLSRPNLSFNNVLNAWAWAVCANDPTFAKDADGTDIDFNAEDLALYTWALHESATELRENVLARHNILHISIERGLPEASDLDWLDRKEVATWGTL